jgi:hypothetical protein
MHEVRLSPTSEPRKETLFGKQQTTTLTVDGQRLDFGEISPAVHLQRTGAALACGHYEGDGRELACEGRNEPTQVRLRPARASRGKEKRVQHNGADPASHVVGD